MKHTHISAPTLFVEVRGVRYAYRKFGDPSGVPLIFLQHFRGGMDHWDPALTDGFAQGRSVILFDNTGVASSSGETPDTIEAMADDAAAFVKALGLEKVDVLGFSIGGYVAQELTLRHPQLVRRLLLTGTGPRAGVPGNDARVPQIAMAHEVPTLEDFLFLFFAPTEKSQAAGRAFWERRHHRTHDVDLPTSKQTMLAQVAAFTAWRHPVGGELHADLKKIHQPTLVVNGNDDVMIPTINSWTLAQNIPNAQLIVYPDAGHGAQFQYPARFLAHATEFLDA